MFGWRPLREVPIDGLLVFVAREAVVLHGRHDADDRVPVVGWPADAQALAERIAVGPVGARKALVDDRDAVRLAGGEVAPSDDWHAHRGEVPVIDAVQLRSLCQAVVEALVAVD